MCKWELFVYLFAAISHELPVVQKLDDGKYIYPPLKGATGPDSKAQGQESELPNYEGEGFVGLMFPGTAFSDGKPRTVYDNFEKVTLTMLCDSKFKRKGKKMRQTMKGKKMWGTGMNKHSPQ